VYRSKLAFGIFVIKKVFGRIVFIMPITFAVSFDDTNNIVVAIIECVNVTQFFSICDLGLANTKCAVYGHAYHLLQIYL